MNDSELKDYFHQNRPQTTDEAAYLAGLSAKMEAAAEIKRLYDASTRRCRRLCAVTFVAGCAVGAAVTVFILLSADAEHGHETNVVASLYLFAHEWKSVIIPVVAAAALVLGLIPWTKGIDVSPIK